MTATMSAHVSMILDGEGWAGVASIINLSGLMTWGLSFRDNSGSTEKGKLKLITA